MRNPNKFVRKAVIDSLKTATGLYVYSNSIPLDKPLKSQYILVTSQSKRKTAQSKTCWDWESSFNVEIHGVNEKGFNGDVQVDDIESLVLTALEGLQVDTWKVKNRELVDTVSLITETPDHTINRSIVVYNLWLAE